MFWTYCGEAVLYVVHHICYHHHFTDNHPIENLRGSLKNEVFIGDQLILFHKSQTETNFYIFGLEISFICTSMTVCEPVSEGSRLAGAVLWSTDAFLFFGNYPSIFDETHV